MDERQMSISMGQAINIASDLVLKNESRVVSNKDLTAQEFTAKMKAAIPDIFLFIKEMQNSASNVEKAMEPVKKKEEQIEEEFI